MICPYCRTEVLAPGEDAMFCNGCGTPHHRECFEENGGCTLFGCKFAPPDEPKVAVSSRELSAAQSWGTTAATSPTGFGDVTAVSLSTAAVASPRAAPPPPPPPPPVSTQGGERTFSAAREGYVTPGGIFQTLAASTSSPQPKSRIAYIMLGIFFGALGIHNFYAGFIGRGISQLCITILTLGYGAVVSWIWAIVEICTVDRDQRNIAFT